MQRLRAKLFGKIGKAGALGKEIGAGFFWAQRLVFILVIGAILG